MDSHLVDLVDVCRISSLVYRTADAPLRPRVPSGNGPSPNFLDPSVGLVLTLLCLSTILDYIIDSSASPPNGRVTLRVHDPYPQCADYLGTSSSAANTCVFIAFWDDSLTRLSNSNFIVFIVLQISLLSRSAFPPVSASKGVYSGQGSKKEGGIVMTGSEE